MRVELPTLLPGTFRARLAIAFCSVVAIALALVLATLPRLLDGYFAQQERSNLQTRTVIMATFLRVRLTESLGLDDPEPRIAILLPTKPPTPSKELQEALGTGPRGFVQGLSDVVAGANVEVTVADAARPQVVVYRLQVPLSEEASRQAMAKGQQRDRISWQESFRLSDPFWSQFGGSVPQRLVTVRLADPFTFRAKTLETVVGVMFGAAGLALAVAIVASILLADRLTTPIRRLTQAARELAEGNLGARVSGPSTGSPEISELASAFNVMAERLQASIEFIRRDRDRSREFLADASHELRTPLAALRTFNELLRNGAAAEPATRAEFLESSRQQIERLDWLAANLLELSKLDSGLTALDLRPEDLRAVVENAIQQAEPAARGKGIDLVVDLPREPIRQRHDPQRMGQVLANLIGNAIKFTPSGGRVTVGLRSTSNGAELRVADTGVGIQPSELPHVFERFYRGSQRGTERGGGSGLGLAIVRSIVDMHVGRVEIASTVGSGTEVVVTLPRDVSISSPAPARG
ncbi:MAG: HAMP domain-containing histidine kinase [Chloroflexota bacterium]|nr:HAMP domain-containing histidine kinase [Chloroflexota bacterium]